MVSGGSFTEALSPVHAQHGMGTGRAGSGWGTGAGMRHLVELPVGDAQTVSVEIEQAADGLGDVSRAGQVADRATRSLGEMLAGVRPVAESFLGAFAGMASVPDEISLEYGLSLSADANLVIATTAAQANFKVTLTWRTPPASGLEGGSFPAAPES